MPVTSALSSAFLSFSSVSKLFLSKDFSLRNIDCVLAVSACSKLLQLAEILESSFLMRKVALFVDGI